MVAVEEPLSYEIVGRRHQMVHVVTRLIFGPCWKGGWRPPCMVAVEEPLSYGMGRRHLVVQVVTRLIFGMDGVYPVT